MGEVKIDGYIWLPGNQRVYKRKTRDPRWFNIVSCKLCVNSLFE